MVNLSDIAVRLDSNEELTLTYKYPVSTPDGQVEYQTRKGKLLDIAEDAKILYVSHESEVVWVKLDEAIDVSKAD